MEISEKVAYLKGLAEGLNLDTDSKEGKLIAAIIDVLDDMAEKFADIEDELCDVEDGLDAVSDDLSDVEETLYFALDDDEDEDEDEDDEEEECFMRGPGVIPNDKNRQFMRTAYGLPVFCYPYMLPLTERTMPRAASYTSVPLRRTPSVPS